MEPRHNHDDSTLYSPGSCPLCAAYRERLLKDDVSDVVIEDVVVVIEDVVVAAVH